MMTCSTINKKIKILHIIYSLGGGGLENILVKIVNNLDPEKFENVICCIQNNLILRKRLNQNVQIHVIDNSKYKNSLIVIFKLMKIIRIEKPDIVHTRNWSTFFEGQIAAILCRVKKRVHSIHGLYTLDIYKINILRRILQIGLFKTLSNIFAVCQYLKEYYSKYFFIDTKRVKVIYNGVDVIKFNKVKRLEKNLYRKRKVIGVIGSLYWVKDHITLIKALSLLKTTNDFELHIIGNGPLRNELEEYAKSLDLIEKIKFTGYLDDVNSHLNDIDIYVNTSLTEGLSNTILEAMAMRCPIIATNVGGNPELVIEGINGYLINPKDYKNLAEKIKILIDNKTVFQKMATNSRNIVLNRFKLDKMIKEYENLYLNLKC